eukprot:TRINITY_DN67796_c0_g1_i1.p1 TRINITY_DN67796_c0_g1~~TRINITY_DN67796_c0_g1_i1.p1  ORF type:complete len:401 (-),score=59.61 TRINITY_DN67796_c0_g1_i1:152-1354(-)
MMLAVQLLIVVFVGPSFVVADERIERLRAQVAREVFGAADAAPLSLDASCDDVRSAALRGVDIAGMAINGANTAFTEYIHMLAMPDLQGDSYIDQPPLEIFFGPLTGAAKGLSQSLHLLSFLVMRYPSCLKSAARSVIHRAMVPFMDAQQSLLETMWWMVDIGRFSNTNSPPKHMKQVVRTLESSGDSASLLVEMLPRYLGDTSQFWGHADDGMFMNSTVYYRRLFPVAALVDKGVLRTLLRLLHVDSTIGDFGALDGQYSSWLNDTGLVTAYAFDGVAGVAEITQGRVSEIDLSRPIKLWRTFDWVMSIEVAEHISPESEATYLRNLASHAVEGLIVSWAPPHVAGEGHINCKSVDESKAIIERLGFLQDEDATRLLRSEASLKWIGESVALYRRASAA